MIMEEKIKRINELYHKSKSVGLTEAEKEEQALLRKAYIESVKMNLKSQLDNIVIRKARWNNHRFGRKIWKTKRNSEKKFLNSETV